jgi:uncharacterized repeat protein (TIGR01451 family)
MKIDSISSMPGCLRLLAAMSCGTPLAFGLNPAPVQTFYIPIPESQLLQAYQTIKPTTVVSQPVDPVQTYVSVAVLNDDTVIYYDHMQNGYDADISHPSNLHQAGTNESGTRIWGDGNTANGFPPGVPSDVLKAGMVIVLNNAIQSAQAPDPAAPRYRGGDKIAASKAVSVTRAGWASGPATMLAGANEVFDTMNWGTDFRVPVGRDIPVNVSHEMFEYTGAAIMAGETGATLQIDADANGSFESTVTLAQGQSHLINNGLNVGARVLASAPVQFDLITGDIHELYESRLYRLLPVSLWSDSYHSPVSTPSSAQGYEGTSTTVWLYNPHAASIEVSYSRRNTSGLSSDVSNKTTAHASNPVSGTTPGSVYGPIVELKSDGSLNGTPPEGAWIGIVNRSSSNSPSIQSKVSKARSAGASAVIIVNNTGGTTYPSDSAGSPVIPVVGMTQNGGAALRAAGLGAGWVRVSGSQTSSSITVPAASYVKQVLTNGYGASFTATNGEHFYALTTTDSTTYDGDTSGSKDSSPVGNYNWDWGITLVPQSSLTQQVLVGLGIGRDPTSSENATENGSPVWVTTIGNGNQNATVYVDFDANPLSGAFFDPNGYGYDLKLTVREHEMVKVYNPTGDQSGMLVYTLDVGVKLAAAWGQDVLVSSRANPGLDMGTGIPPLPKFVASKRSVLVNDRDGDGHVSPGDRLEYEIGITNISRVPISGLKVEDMLPGEVVYVNGSTRVTAESSTTPIADSATATAFPLDAGGVTLPGSALAPFKTWTVSYKVDIKSFGELPEGTREIRNMATISSSLLALTDAVTVQDVRPLYGRIGDYVWNDRNANGVQDPGEPCVAAVTVHLYGESDNLLASTTTDDAGCYLFTGLVAGNYHIGFVTPSGYLFCPQDATGDGLRCDIDSDADTFTGKTATVVLLAGEPMEDADAGLMQPGAISGHVFVQTTPLAGVTLTLLDNNGNPVDADPDTEGVQPLTTVSGANGYYAFHNLPPGTYQVGQSQPAGYLSFGDADGGDPDIIGDVTPIALPPGHMSENNDFVETLDTCPDDWDQWKFQHPGETAAGNPDADAYDNFAEFAFAMPYDRGTGSGWLGSTAWIIQQSSINPETLEAVFIRPQGAYLNATYTLQVAATLGNPTSWQPILIDTGINGNATTVNNGDCTETVTIHDLETLTGLTGGEGFVRIQVDLDDNGGNNGDIDHTSHTEVEGWTWTELEVCCRTYNVPYQRETAFTGTISEVSDEVLVFADADSLDTLLTAGGSYYIEVTSGDNEGHRRDIVSAAGNTITVAAAADLHAAAAPFTTLAVIAPSTLVGDTVAVRRHWTLDEVFPPTGFGASNTMKSADEVQIFAGGAWSMVWLFSNDGAPMWIKAGADSTLNQGSTVIPPGQGMFFNNRHTATSILSYGEVRANDFIRPLGVGNNLVGGGYPLSQSANGPGGRAMNLASGFFGSRDFSTADSIFIWKADTQLNAPGYDTYYLADARSVFPDVLRWVKVGDPSLAIRDAEVILHGNRAAFVRSRNGVPQHTSLCPWLP